MTVEELEQLIKAKNTTGLIEGMKDLDDTQRRALAPKAVEMYKRAHRREGRATFLGMSSDQVDVAINALRKDWELSEMSGLAVLGLCAWKDARRVRLSMSWRGDAHGVTEFDYLNVLKDRRPDWLDQWVEANLALDQSWVIWDPLRILVREGFCKRPETPGYIFWMIRQHLSNPKLVFRDDPGLLEDEVWRIFDTDFGDLRAFGSFGIDQDGWRKLLVDLVKDGKLDRQRILNASLHALNRKAHASNLSWFANLHEALEPTVEERFERQATYRDLLANSNPPTVGFALDALKALVQGKRLEVGLFAAQAGLVFLLKPKAPAIKAIGILKAGAKLEPSRKSQIIAAAAEGLSHPIDAVQESALDLINGLVTGPDATVVAAIEAASGNIGPAHRMLLNQILLRAGAAVEAVHEVAIAVQTDSSGQIDELVDDAMALPEHWRKMAGIDECVEAFKKEGQVPAVTARPLAVPRLDQAAKIEPIGGFDELIDAMSKAIEEPASSDELERIYDGLSRMADQRPIDLVERISPLTKRIESLRNSGQLRSTMLAVLIDSWRDECVIPTEKDRRRELSTSGFISRRCSALSKRLKDRVAGPLLALPTHRGGWIDPVELVRRIRWWQENREGTTDRLDLIQAILRLAPDRRGEALAASTGLDGIIGGSLRYALGGPLAEQWDLALLAAAVRARDPWGAFPQTVTEDLGPDTVTPAEYQWSAGDSKIFSRWNNVWNINLNVGSTAKRIDLPLTLLHGSHIPMWWTGEIEEMFSVWPLNPDPVFAQGTNAVLDRVNSPASTFSALSPFFVPIFDADTRLSEMACLLISVGLIAKDPGGRGGAIDAMIAAIQDGRMSGEELPRIMQRLMLDPQMVKLNRLASALIEVARCSALHQYTVKRMIIGILSILPQPAPGDLHHLLSPLRDWLMEAGEALPASARPLLESIGGGGKTKSLATAILKLQEKGNPATRGAVFAEALRGRIARVRRWEERTSVE